MSRFLGADESVPVALDGGDVVHIKPRMTYGDHRTISALFTALGRDERASALAEYQLLLLERNIVRWEGPGFSGPDGEPLAVTRERIDALDGETAQLILNAINERNPAPVAHDDPKGSRRARSSSARSSGTARASRASTRNSASSRRSAGRGTSS